MEQLQNCKHCGRIFVSYGLALCPECTEAYEKKLRKIKDFLIENPLSSVFEVSVKMNTEIRMIKRYLREERLEIVEKENRFLLCEICGKSIVTGKYCPQCAEVAKKSRTVAAKSSENYSRLSPFYDDNELPFLKRARTKSRVQYSFK